MPDDFSKLNLKKITQIRRFKINYQRVNNLKYIDRDNLKMQSFVDFKKIGNIVVALNAVKVARPTFTDELGYLRDYTPVHYPKGKMLIIVNFDLYPAISASVSQYVRDLAYEGFYADVYKYRGGSAVELRNFIIGKMPVAGALMIGNLPVAWFEMTDDFHGAAEFPCDLYYMDLNGTWSDPDADGKFSAHPANVTPEIWVGRLWTPDQNGNNAVLINDYFNRNHRFRKGLFGYSNRALAYVDDDWAGFGDCSFDLMFPAANIEVITDPATTDGDRYKVEINEKRAWAQICAHSSPNGHSFKIPGGTEWIPNTYLRDDNPPNSYFYNLFACSNARFTQPEYMAGWYIFDKAGGFVSNGLAAVGSTKTGSMLYFENFYGPMGAAKLLGEAYVGWWNGLGATHDLGERQWFYGMVILGDPTINWWTGVVPILQQPFNNQVFSHYPRKTNFRWTPITLPNTTVQYYVEIDAFGARVSGKWSADTGRTWLVSGPLNQATYEHFFVGAQRGRWRVRVKAGGILCPWSDWGYFRYTV
jgi:hypothetical protein